MKCYAIALVAIFLTQTVTFAQGSISWDKPNYPHVVGGVVKIQGLYTTDAQWSIHSPVLNYVKIVNGAGGLVNQIQLSADAGKIGKFDVMTMGIIPEDVPNLTSGSTYHLYIMATYKKVVNGEVVETKLVQSPVEIIIMP